ncbi:MAG: TetR family transcriptional regulator [Marmoricola sp.]|nr:TetR family transcriptional regulator [Marmoricola sp.]
MTPPVFPDSPTVVAATEAALALMAEAGSTPDVDRDFSVRLVRSFLALCENPRTRHGMLRMVRASVGSARAGQAFYRVINRSVVNPAAKATGVHASAMKVELVCGQLVGLAMMRYVLQVEPVASASAEDLVVLFAPAIRATVQAG